MVETGRLNMNFDTYKASARREALLKEAEQDRLADIAQENAPRFRLVDVFNLLLKMRRVRPTTIVEHPTQPRCERVLEA
jgi:hypothetical protein